MKTLATTFGAMLLAVMGCGGTADVPREEPPVATKFEGVDFGDCKAVTKRYEFQLVTDVAAFDTGSNIRSKAPVYYYTNNDETNPSRELTDDEINKQGREREPCNCYPDEESAPGGGEIKPVEGGAPSLDSETLCEPSDRSVQLHTEAPGFTGWGMVFGASFEGTGVETVNDASAWEGLAVWVKRESSQPLSMFAAVVDQYTVSSGGFCQDEGLLENACDAFGIGVGFEEDWRLVLMPFSQLTQRGFGFGSPEGKLEVEALRGFAFYLPSGVWKVRLDELSFYRAKRSK